MRTPAQFKNNQHRNRNLEELERKIDNAIDGAALFGKSTVTVGCAGYPSDVVDQMIGEYRRLGWRAERVLDSRDGDFISMEAQ